MMKKKETGSDTAQKSSSERYAERLYKFDSFYIQLIVCSAAVSAAAIAAAVLANVMIGILTAAALALIYAYFSADELRRDLGIRVRLCGVDLRITSFKALTGNEVFVPARLMWRDVTEIADGSFSCEANAEIEIIHIPSTITRIEKGAFDGCTSLKKICFESADVSRTEIDADISPYETEFGVPYPEKIKKKTGKPEAVSVQDAEEKEFDSTLYELPTENADASDSAYREKENGETTE